MILMFQGSDPLLHHLHSEVDELLRSILADFMKMDVVKSCDPFAVSLDDPSLLVTIEHVYLGVQATMTLQECSIRDQEAIRKENLPTIHDGVGKTNQEAIRRTG